MVSFTPIGDADVRSKSRIDQVRSHGGFDQSAPIIALVSGFREGTVILRTQERGVQHLQFGA